MRRSLTRTMLMDLPPHLPRRVCGWLCVGHASRLCRLGLHALGGWRRRRCGCGWWWVELRKFRHFPGYFEQLIYQLSIFRQGECNFRIWFAQQPFEPVQFGGGRRERPRGLREEALRPWRLDLCHSAIMRRRGTAAWGEMR